MRDHDSSSHLARTPVCDACRASFSFIISLKFGVLEPPEGKIARLDEGFLDIRVTSYILNGALSKMIEKRIQYPIQYSKKYTWNTIPSYDQNSIPS